MENTFLKYNEMWQSFVRKEIEEGEDKLFFLMDELVSGFLTLSELCGIVNDTKDPQKVSKRKDYNLIVVFRIGRKDNNWFAHEYPNKIHGFPIDITLDEQLAKNVVSKVAARFIEEYGDVLKEELAATNEQAIWDGKM